MLPTTLLQVCQHAITTSSCKQTAILTTCSQIANSSTLKQIVNKLGASSANTHWQQGFGIALLGTSLLCIFKHNIANNYPLHKIQVANDMLGEILCRNIAIIIVRTTCIPNSA